jgi:hypothetical protein
VSDALPKQELLIKLMGMTTASNDGEALNALRMANRLLDAAGWDWKRLIEGRITVVEDPFKSIHDPFAGRRTQSVDVDMSTPRYRPAPTPPSPTPAQAPNPPQPFIVGVSTNRFPAFCWNCAVEVLAGKGKIFKPSTHNPHAPSTWQVICAPCEAVSPACKPFAAVQSGSRRKKSVGDLA